jgi:hypothetical protein
LKKKASSNVIDFSFEKKLREDATEQMKRDTEGLNTVDPLFSAYLFVFRRLVDFANCTLGILEVKKYEKFINESTEYLQPSFPPMSPISDSYFNLWSVCDVRLAAGNDETMASCFAECLQSTNKLKNKEIAILAERLAYSHMSFLEQIEPATSVYEKSHFKLPVRDIFSGDEFWISAASGYAGEVGKIWFGRVLPSLSGLSSTACHIFMGTPYIFEKQDKNGILAFLERAIHKVKGNSREESYRKFMKFGLEKRYWPNFIFNAYVNFEPGAIFLTGVPDIPLTQPHSPESEDTGKWTPLSSINFDKFSTNNSENKLI